VLAEVEDHLCDAVAASESGGLTRREVEQEAVRRMGPAALVAARLVTTLAAAALRRAAMVPPRLSAR
jgi:hypothetical protein